jgi:hypothetical protein
MRLKSQTPMYRASSSAGLRWRSQFAPEPTHRFPRFHRVGKRDHALMHMIASGAFECPDVKAERAGRAGRGSCQHRHRFALRAWRSVERAHDVVPYIKAGAQYSQSPVVVVSGGDGDSLERQPWPPLFCFAQVHKKINELGRWLIALQEDQELKTGGR